ncbi:unnamed protein product [Closterium sp. NIES-65]|nr:unnamed protein product [Closterium sp. NIES-65]
MGVYELGELKDAALEAPDEAVVELADIALDCLKMPASRRPNMKDVARRLQNLLSLYCGDEDLSSLSEPSLRLAGTPLSEHCKPIRALPFGLLRSIHLLNPRTFLSRLARAIFPERRCEFRLPTMELLRPKLSLAFLTVALLASVTGITALYGPSSDVANLSPSNFKSAVIESGEVVLVEFFAPWCGHCKNLAPAWEKAATALKGIVTVAAVDCDANPSIAQEYGVQGFPTIKVFAPHLKTPADYQGQRDAKAIVDFALSQVKSLVSARLGGKVGGGGGGSGGGRKAESGPSASVVLTGDNFDDLVVNSKELWLVEFFAPWCGHCKNLAPEWSAAARALKGRVNLGQVDCTVEQSLAQRFKIQGFPTILVFGDDKENPKPYEGPRVASGIESYALELLEQNMPPPEVHEITSQDVLAGCTDSTICFVTFLPHILDSGASGRNKYLDTILAVADKFKKNFYKYVWAEAGAQPALEKALGVGGYGYPALIALNAKKQRFSPFKSAFEQEHLSEFVRLAARGGRGIEPVESIPEAESREPWDGKDGQVVEEEEFSLEDLMGDDSPAAAAADDEL